MVKSPDVRVIVSRDYRAKAPRREGPGRDPLKRRKKPRITRMTPIEESTFNAVSESAKKKGRRGAGDLVGPSDGEARLPNAAPQSEPEHPDDVLRIVAFDISS
jgi:hypothetical protein